MDTPKKPKVVVASATVTTPHPVVTGTNNNNNNNTTTNTLTSVTAESGTAKEKLTESQRNLQQFWPGVIREVQQIDNVEPGNQLLPLARIKKIMKLDEDVKMISSDAPLLFAKAIEIFIQELTLRAWLTTEHNKRRTLQRSDIAMAITKYDQFDFLIDIVPRDETKVYRKEYEGKPIDGGSITRITATAITENGAGNSSSTNGSEDMQFFFQLAQQHQKVAVQNSTKGGVVGALTNGTGTVFDLATVIGAAATTAPTATIATTTKQDKNGSAGSGEAQPGGGSGSTSGTTASQQQQPQPSSQTTVQTAAGQSIILANGSSSSSSSNSSSSSSGTGTASGVTNGSTTTANQLVSTNQSLQLLQHVMTPSGEITQIPLNFIRTAGTGGATNSGQPIFIQTAPMQAGPTIIHTGSTGVFVSANQLQQLQQPQQQQQNQQNQQNQPQHNHTQHQQQSNQQQQQHQRD